MIYPYKLNLQLFAEGAGDGGSGAAGAGATGVNPQDAAAGMSGVMQMDAASGNRSGRGNSGAGAQGQAAAQQDDAAWQEAKTRHKARYDAEVQQILRGRLKTADDNQRILETLQPMLDAMAKRHGIKAGDHQALVDKYLDDDSLYEDEAIETGMSVDAVKQLHQLRAERDRAQAEVSRFTEQAQVQQHLQGLVQQGEAFRAKYPNFDLQAAMQDDRFVRMTSPNGGLTVEQAYAALHHDEMQAWAMQQAAQQARMQSAQTVQANMARPRENATRGMAPPARVTDDPSRLTANQIREQINQAIRGVKTGY